MDFEYFRRCRSGMIEAGTQAGDEGLRLAAAQDGLHPEGVTERQCLTGTSAQAAQYGR